MVFLSGEDLGEESVPFAAFANVRVYGLDARWTGPRILEGWATVRDEPKKIALGHGYRWSGSSWVQVVNLLGSGRWYGERLSERLSDTVMGEWDSWVVRGFGRGEDLRDISVELPDDPPVMGRTNGFISAAWRQYGDDEMVVVWHGAVLPVPIVEVSGIDEYVRGYEEDLPRRTLTT